MTFDFSQVNTFFDLFIFIICSRNMNMLHLLTMKNELIQTAIENLQKEIPISIELKGTVPVDETLVVKWDGHQIQLLPWVRNEIRTQFYPQLAERFKNQKDLILVANKIYPKVKELLRADGIPYIETAGNIFFESKWDIYITRACKGHK